MTTVATPPVKTTPPDPEDLAEWVYLECRRRIEAGMAAPDVYPVVLDLIIERGLDRRLLTVHGTQLINKLFLDGVRQHNREALDNQAPRPAIVDPTTDSETSPVFGEQRFDLGKLRLQESLFHALTYAGKFGWLPLGNFEHKHWEAKRLAHEQLRASSAARVKVCRAFEKRVPEGYKTCEVLTEDEAREIIGGVNLWG